MALTEYVIMPAESYKGLCDMIREKTGETGSLTIQQLLEKAEPLANVSSVTAATEDVRAGKVFVDAEGNEVEGTADTEDWVFTMEDDSTVTKKVVVME